MSAPLKVVLFVSACAAVLSVGVGSIALFMLLFGEVAGGILATLLIWTLAGIFLVRVGALD